MKKKLVFLTLALVLVLATAVALAADGTVRYLNELHDTPYASIVGSSYTNIRGQMVTITRTEVVQAATCTQEAILKIFWDNSGDYELGYFKYDNKRHTGHVWAHEFPSSAFTYDSATNTLRYTSNNNMVDNVGNAITLAVTKAPTCDKPGEAKDVCVYCGVEYTQGKVTIPAINHSWVKAFSKLPTCVNNYNGTGIWQCKVCGQKRPESATSNKAWSEPVTLAQALADPGYKAALLAAGVSEDGHQWDAWVTVDPCTKTHHCLLCKLSKQVRSDPKWIELGTEIVNCYTKKVTVVCGVCNGAAADPAHQKHVEIITAQDEADKSGIAGDTAEKHAWHTWKKNAALSVAATCTTDGYDYMVCQACGKTAQWETKRTDHKVANWTMEYAPGQNGNAEGKWVGMCAACKQTIEYYGKTAPKTGYVDPYNTDPGKTGEAKTGLKLVGGNWTYFIDDVAQTALNTFVYYNGSWFKIKNGVLDKVEGVYEYNGGLFYLSGGQVRSDLNGFVNTPEGFLYFAAGQLQTQATTLVQYDGAWFYIINGRLATGFSGTVTYDGAEFKVVNGQVV